MKISVKKVFKMFYPFELKTYRKLVNIFEAPTIKVSTNCNYLKFESVTSVSLGSRILSL